MGVAPDPDLQNRNIFEGALADAQILLDEIQSMVGDVQPCSIKGLTDRKSRAVKLSSTIAEQQDQLRSLQNDSMQRKSEINQDRVVRNRIESITRYVCHTSIDKLTGLKGKLSEGRQNVTRLKKVIQELKGTNLAAYSEIRSSLKIAIEGAELERSELRKKSGDLSRVINEYEDRRGKLASLAEEIRALGRMYIEYDAEATDCPLCGAQYEKGRLAELFNEQIRELDKSAIIVRSFSEQATILNDLKGVDESLEELSTLRRAAAIYYAGESFMHAPLASIVKELSDLNEEVRLHGAELDELESLNALFGEYGLQEAEYEDLKKWFEKQYPDVACTYGNLGAIEELGKIIEKILEEKKQALDKVEDEIVKSKGNVKSILEGWLNTTELHESPLSVIDSSIKHLDVALNLFADIGKYIRISEEQQLTEIRLQAKKIKEVWLNYSKQKLEAMEYSELASSIESKLVVYKNDIARYEENRNRAEKAIEILNNILERDSKEQHVRDYLRENIDRIFTIFRRIHAPREFRHISINDSGGIALSDAQGSPRLINQISSGQRAALALAIFLAMNAQASKAPRFLLFDDPVAFVDDLNALAFIDYLREVVLRGNRQLVFATANRKLANLFEKKFEFLGDQYVRHNLLRG